ncbi:MAG: DNA polymerase III subunit delta' [Gammaproteobacteria bacterium]
MKPLPWQRATFDSLRQQSAEGRLAHALLFTGPSGVGKRHCAQAFIAADLCRQPGPTGEACGECPSCQQLAVGSHPDVRRVEPPEDKTVITVDQVRSMIDFINLSGQYGERRFALIDPADSMNENASNALLKTLEEPGSGSVLILVTSTAGALLPTLRSRCQQWRFPVPPNADALSWLADSVKPAADDELARRLAIAGGAPLMAAAFDDEMLTLRGRLAEAWLMVGEGRRDPIEAADDWKKISPCDGIRWLMEWAGDCARLAADPNAPIADPSLGGRLQGLAQGLDLATLTRWHAEVANAHRRCAHGLNAQLVFEDLMASWAAVCRTRQGVRPTRSPA